MTTTANPTSELLKKIALLPAREQEALRLKYAEGLPYAEIAAAMKLPVGDVGKSLFQAVKGLRADHAGNEQDHAKILAFVHGELDQPETQKFASRIEAEEELRKEFESVLATSDALEDLLSKPAPKKPSAKPASTRPPRSRKSFLISGAAVLAASLVLVVILKIDQDRREVAENAAAPQSEVLVDRLGGNTQTDGNGEPISTTPAPPVDNLAAQNPPPTEPPPLPAQGPMGGEAPPPEPEVETPPSAPPMPPQKIVQGKSLVIKKEIVPVEEVSNKKMGVLASKAIFSKGIDKKKALLQVQRLLDGKPSCVPADLGALKSITAVISAAKNGSVTKIQTTPASPEATECLKLKLSGKIPAFKSKAGGKITLLIKIF